MRGSSTPTVALVIFEGGAATSLPEQMLRQVREGIVLDRVAQARRIQALDPIVLVTDREDLARKAEALGAHIYFTQSHSFHFGLCLQAVIRHYELERVLYMGGGAAPLASPMEIGRIVSLLQRAEALAAANNYHSADVVAFTPAVRALSAPLPPLDNLLAQALVEAGLPYRPLPRSLGLNFDVDTPTDLMVLAVHPAVGRATAAALKELELNLEPVRRAAELLLTPQADVLIFGRVGGGKGGGWDLAVWGEWNDVPGHRRGVRPEGGPVRNQRLPSHRHGRHARSRLCMSRGRPAPRSGRGRRPRAPPRR